MKKTIHFLACILGFICYSQETQKIIVRPPDPSDPTIVIFSYDYAGNQVFRGPTGIAVCTSCKGSESESTAPLADQVENKIKVAPVPVKTNLTVIWDLNIKDYITKIELLPYNAFNIMETVDINSLTENSYIFKMSNYAYGIYYLKFYLTDGSIYTRTVTKH